MALSLRSASSSSSHSPRSRNTSSPILTTPFAKPVRLIYCDDNGMFRMDAEAVAALQLVKEPIGVVSVCGRARQGKSFILNQLLGRSSGFHVASTHRPCTKGLWMWSTPIKRTALDGTEYSLLLLDTEGVDAFDQTGTYSTQIFSLAVLLSSMFVYNQMGGIDEAALDQLSLITEMTKHIRVRASENRPSNAELGPFSPIFLWLLRDFYLDLSVEDKRISPRDYLEAALQPISGQGKSITAKNLIRDSIKALFPDRDCFTLVRPLNDERDLQRLDQIPLEHMRPEFQSGLEGLIKFIFERTKPKQLGSVVLNGPMLANLIQSFLDAFNAGAVPTIATSWQSVEESECRRAFDTAMETYDRAFSERSVENEVIFQAIHEKAMADAINVYNNEAVGEGAARQKYEKLLTATLKKNFQESLFKVVMETELKCVKIIEKMDEQLWATCQSSESTIEHALEVLIELVTEYDVAASGPAKWNKFAKFLQNSLRGPLLGITKKLNHQTAAEISSNQMKFKSLEDKLSAIEKQLDVSKEDAREWKKRYESVFDQSKTCEAACASQLMTLQKAYDALEEKFKSVTRQHEAHRKETSEWRTQYELAVSARNAKEEQLNVEMGSLLNRCSAAEGRLAAAHEQLQSVKAEAEEWRRKYEAAVEESNTTSENATVICDRVTKQFQAREDAMREEFSSKIAVKERECKDVQDKLEVAQKNISRLQAHVEDQALKLNVEEEELTALRLELKSSKVLSDSAKATAVSLQKQLDLLNQENGHLEERIGTLLTRVDEAEKAQRLAEEEKRLAVERAEIALEEASITRKEKQEAERLAAERLTAQESAERRYEAISREKDDLAKEVEMLQNAEQDTVVKVKSLDKQLEERDREMKGLLDSAHKQKANTIHVLESLLKSERQACAEANSRAEALSLQLQATQNRLDALQQELSTTHLNEAVLDAKLRIRHIKTPGKRSRYDDETPEESVQNTQVEKDSPSSQKKPCNSTDENGNGTPPSTIDSEIPQGSV